MLVVDASVILALHFPDEAAMVDIVIDQTIAGGQAIVPVHWAAEVANGLLFGVRRKRISADFRDKAMQCIENLPVHTDMESMQAFWSATPELAERHDLSVYDAAYLELALRKRCNLATLDKRLGEAASREGVQIVGQVAGG